MGRGKNLMKSLSRFFSYRAASNPRIRDRRIDVRAKSRVYDTRSYALLPVPSRASLLSRARARPLLFLPRDNMVKKFSAGRLLRGYFTFLKPPTNYRYTRVRVSLLEEKWRIAPRRESARSRSRAARFHARSISTGRGKVRSDGKSSRRRSL